MPKENTAGKMITPARIATSESSMAVVKAVLPRRVLLLKYEAYVIMHPRPRLSEKNACPRAPRSTEGVISGRKRNESPS